MTQVFLRNSVSSTGEILRLCCHCELRLPLENFNPRSGRPTGHLPFCKKCAAAVARKRYASNPEAAARISKKYRDSHPEKMAALYRKNWIENSTQIKADRRARYSSDPSFKARLRLGNFLYVELEKYRSGRISTLQTKAKFSDLVGCPASWLSVHLESLFRPGMTWENYGPVWHVDHVRPCVIFNLADPEQQKICFHWTNQQPLFAAENLKKGKLLA